jgi:hypothetical protein
MPFISDQGTKQKALISATQHIAKMSVLERSRSEFEQLSPRRPENCSGTRGSPQPLTITEVVVERLKARKHWSAIFGHRTSAVTEMNIASEFRTSGMCRSVRVTFLGPWDDL